MITTVCGDIPKEKLGVTLPHEHIFCDLRPLVSPYGQIGRQKLFLSPITLQNYGHLRRNPYAVLDNAVLDDEAQQADELRQFLAAGGDAGVDATTADFGRDPELLYRVSRLTGVRVVMGCGQYVDASQSPAVRAMDAGERAELMLRELTEGADGTDIRAGVIGELGTSREITPSEYRTLEAAAAAQKVTGAGVHIHGCLWNDSGAAAAQYLLDRGVDPLKICVNHADAVLDMDYVWRLLRLGVLVEFDNFGKEFTVDKANRNLLEGAFATDAQRCDAAASIADAGKLGQLLITNDICLKMLTHAWGGWGYDHILRHIVPTLAERGFSRADIRRLLVETPAEFLDRGGERGEAR